MNRCHKITNEVVPKFVKDEIKNVRRAFKNFVGSVTTLYKGVTVSKQTYNAIRTSLSMCSDETGVRSKHIDFVENISGCSLIRT